MVSDAEKHSNADYLSSQQKYVRIRRDFKTIFDEMRANFNQNILRNASNISINHLDKKIIELVSQYL